LVLLVLVVAAAGGVYALNWSNDDPTDTTGGLPTPHVSIGSPTPSSTPTPTATAKPTPTAKPLPRVKPSAPKRLVVAALLDVGFDSTVTPENGLFQAASTAEVARWGGRGVPGSPAADTVYLIGKVTAGGALQRLPRLHRGTRIFLRTQTGVLTYTVQATADRQARGLATRPDFAKRVAGRLQLVGIRYDASGDRTGRILVVTAQLTGARRSS
jgi:hypothetical protein